MKSVRIGLVAVVLGLWLAAGSFAGIGSAQAAPLSVAPNSRAALVSAAGAARDTVLARKVLSALAARYRYLDGVTVTVGATPDGKQAVAYYADGRIVISDDHTVSIETILGHEIWHIIDWRADGRLDWGEGVPPASADDYLIR